MDIWLEAKINGLFSSRSTVKVWFMSRMLLEMLVLLEVERAAHIKCEEHDKIRRLCPLAQQRHILPQILRRIMNHIKGDGGMLSASIDKRAEMAANLTGRSKHKIFHNGGNLLIRRQKPS